MPAITAAVFLLRIEDTDRQRSTPEAVAAIIDGLSWLGLDWDGDIVHQFARAERHAEVARQLLAAGRAYHCYCTPDELEAMREQARAEKRSVRYRRPLARPRPGRGARRASPPVIRLQAPQKGATMIRRPRAGRGHGRQRRARRPDPAARRRHADLQFVGRGRRPRHGHHPCDPRRRPSEQRLPPDADLPRARLDGARIRPYPADPRAGRRQAVEAARRARRRAVSRLGYLPEALRNYLLRLGWSHGDDEIIATERGDPLVRHRRTSAAPPARFDFAKLDSLNGIISARRTTPAGRAGAPSGSRRSSAGSCRATDREPPAAARCPASSRAPRRSSNWPRKRASTSRRARSRPPPTPPRR